MITIKYDMHAKRPSSLPSLLLESRSQFRVVMPWGVIDVRECGAAGDDRTDDTDAVLQAIDRLPPSGGVLYFPPGQYILKQHLLIHDKPVTVRGEGVGLSRLIWPEDAASAGLVISQGARQDEQTDFTRVQHLSFYTRQRDVGEGLTINCEGQKADECGGIVVNRTNPRVFLDNLEFRGQNICLHGWWVCIKSRCAMHTVMSNIHMVGCTDWKSIGVLFEGGCGHVEIQLSQCWCFYCDHAVLVNDGLEGLKLSQCDFVAVNNGVTVTKSCLQLNVVNNHINARVACINGNDIAQSCIMGNLFYKDPSSETHTVGVQIAGSSSWNIIANNIFFNVNSNEDLAFHAIVLQALSNQNLIQGNNFGSCQDAIICQQDATSNTACGNIFHVVKNQFQDQDGRNKFYPM
ncbi:hypothetical protein WJX77_003866 [Trebouxia sp. C0004]